MSVSVAAKLLAGWRPAIVEVAGNRSWLIPGVLLVLAGGLARHYDEAGVLSHIPAIFRGLPISIVNSLILYTLVFFTTRAEIAGMRFGRGYLAFLSVFWMTSPMAWLYGIPYELFLDPVGALESNLATLGFISLWRVALCTWALAVIFGVDFWRIIFTVMLFCDVVMLVALMVAPLPPVDMMGGMDRSPRDALLADTAFVVGVLGVLTLPVWLIGMIIGAWYARAAPLAMLAERRGTPRGALWMAIAAVILWTTALVIMQTRG